MNDFDIEFEMMQQQTWRRLTFGSLFEKSKLEENKLRKIFEDDFEQALFKFSSRKFAEIHDNLEEKEMREALDNAYVKYDKNKRSNSKSKEFAKYEVHDIEQTNIYKGLKTIERILNKLKKAGTESNIIRANEASQALIREVRELPWEIQNSVLSYISDASEISIQIHTDDIEPEINLYLSNRLCAYLKESKEDKAITFDDIFATPEAKEKCFEALEEVEATVKGKPNNLTKGKAGVIGGVILALKDKTKPNIFTNNFTEENLLKFFNTYLGTNYTRFSKESKQFKQAYKTTKDLLKTMKS